MSQGKQLLFMGLRGHLQETMFFYVRYRVSCIFFLKTIPSTLTPNKNGNVSLKSRDLTYHDEWMNMDLTITKDMGIEPSDVLKKYQELG